MRNQSSESKKEKFVILRAYESLSLERISSRLKISKSTACEWDREFKDRLGSIRNSKLTSLLDHYSLGLSGQIKRLHKLNQRLEKEIQNRNLSELSIDKLIQRYYDSLKHCIKIGELIKETEPETKDVSVDGIVFVETEDTEEY